MVAIDLDAIKVIDTDSHVIEPEDLWTSRVSVRRWGDRVPHVRWDAETNEDAWFFGDARVCSSAHAAMAYWHEYPPMHAKHLADTDRRTWDPAERLAMMDDYKIHAQVLYPNVAGFGAGNFLEVREPELMIELVRAYNDFLVDFSSGAEGRYIPVMSLPFWDVQASLAEMERAHEAGHRGIVFGSQPEHWGQPDITDRHWDPIWAQAQEMQLTINFHIASGDVSDMNDINPANGPHANFASKGLPFFMGNARAIARLTTGGVCHRFPKLNFVSVESGIGWLPYALDCLDWQWRNCGVHKEHPEYDLLPSEYFKRQIYGTFWFERDTARQAVALLGADNFMYETDFPHPTSMTPGPATEAQRPDDFIRATFEGFDEESTRKILHDNAARLYHVD